MNEENPSSAWESDCRPIPVQDIDDDLEVLCARTEALHVHGYHTVAGKLAVKLADNFLSYGTKLNLSSHCNGSKSKAKQEQGCRSYFTREYNIGEGSLSLSRA